MLEDVKNLDDHGLEVFVVFQDLRILESTDIALNSLKAFAEDVRLATDVQVELNITSVLARYLRVHFNVVFVLRILLVVRVQQVLLAFQVFVDLAVHFDVLERSVEDDEALEVDGPVVEVRNVPFEHKFERADRRHVVFVLAIQAFQKVCTMLATVQSTYRLRVSPWAPSSPDGKWPS